MHSPDEDARDHAQGLADDRQLREEDWLDWCRMDRPDDDLMCQLLDTWALYRETCDRVQRIRDNDPELVAK
jgi:hypothetical protein